MRAVLLIANPVSGKGRGKEIAPQLARSLEERGDKAEIYFTQGAGDAERAARERTKDFDWLLGVGGDGTLNAIVNGAPLRTAVGLFPLGTANVLATELDLPRTVESFAARLANDRWSEIDLLRANGRLIVFSLGVGIDGMVIAHLEKRRGPRGLDKFSYLPIAISEFLRYRTPRLRITLEGESPRETGFALASNTKNYGGFFHLSPQRRLDDGRWECYLFSARGKAGLFGLFLRGLTGRLLRARDPFFRAVQSFAIESAEPGREIPVQVDGEAAGVTPVRGEVVPKGMRIWIG